MGSIYFELRDHLKHKAYTWPVSLLRYPLRFEPGEAHRESFALVNRDGERLPMQLSGLELDGDFVRSAEVSFLSDLPMGADYRYELRYGSIPVEELQDRTERDLCGETGAVGNGLFRVHFPDTGASDGRLPSAIPSFSVPAFRLERAEGEGIAWAAIVTDRHVTGIDSVLLASGPIYCERVLTYTFVDGSVYALHVRIARGMTFIELEESMEGFAEGHEAKLEIAWAGLSPSRRYARHRGDEAIDDYLGAAGEMPFRLLPYDNSQSWHRCRTAAFEDRERRLTAGVFPGDATRWDDREYALWRHSDTLALRFYYRPDSPSGEGCRQTLVWSYPLAAGSRATTIALCDPGDFQSREPEAFASPIEELALWHGLLPLDKVKDWVLQWEEPQEQFPRLFDPAAMPRKPHFWYFEREGLPRPADMDQLLDELSVSFNQIALTSPVRSREFASWAPIFDLAAPAMTAEQFKRAQAASAFMAYVREDEGIAPIRNALAGHPNFLADFTSVPAFMAALFPHHPHAGRWADHFERAMALNLKYHTRPAVPAWRAEGGRWTENLGCYVWAALVPMVRAAWCLNRTYGDCTLLYPNLSRLADWILNSLSAPVAGRRSCPPQGAHAGAHLDPLYPPYILRVLGQMLMGYDPLLGERLLAVCPPEAEGFEVMDDDSDLWRIMLDKEWSANPGTPPLLASSKYTGYGYILRAAAGTSEEMSVHLQQIDEGPNYRWGRAGEGGSGTLYYYANGRRYSCNRPEDVGDDNMRDGEGSTNFAVLAGREYRSIGRADATEPFYDFGFAQFARLAAGPYAAPFYRSRSILLAGNDYIVVYDEVSDMRVMGRFTWFTHKDEEFPTIYQLKPGASEVPVELGGPVDKGPILPGHYDRPNYLCGYPSGTRGKQYDGMGHFLTVVTHRSAAQPPVVSAEAAPYGAVISLSGRTDRIFRDAARIQYDDGHIAFDGQAGIVRVYGESRFEAALFEGRAVAAGGIAAELIGSEGTLSDKAPGAFAFVTEPGMLHGHSMACAPLSVRLTLSAELAADDFVLYINGKAWPTARGGADGARTVAWELPTGACRWEWTKGQPTPPAPQLEDVIVSSGAAELAWRAQPAADWYQVGVSRDACVTWSIVADDLSDTVYRLQDVADGEKLHIRVRAANAGALSEWSEPYPVYGTEQPPAPPEGLRLTREDAGVRASWGMRLGCREYRLYRRRVDEEQAVMVYEGSDRAYVDAADELANGAWYAYSVAAVNGNGEGERSQERDTRPGGLIDWDPCPKEPFRRYTRSHEYGYNGFHFWENERKGSLAPYPQ